MSQNLKYLNPLYWKKSILFFLLTAFVLVWISFIDSYSLKTRYDLSSKKDDLKKRTEQLNLQSEELRIKIANLEKDSKLLEKIAREEYGMRKPGETVYKIKRSK